MNIIDQLEQEQIAEVNRPVPEFSPGDTLRVNVRVVEGNRERTQAFEGVCIARRNRGVNSSFTVRKISYGTHRRKDHRRCGQDRCGRAAGGTGCQEGRRRQESPSGRGRQRGLGPVRKGAIRRLFAAMSPAASRFREAAEARRLDRPRLDLRYDDSGQ